MLANVAVSVGTRSIGECLRLMSALGQKQTCRMRNAMSALPPKADIL